MDNKFLDEPDAPHDDESKSPIYGYQDQQIMTLEKAVESITHEVPGIMNDVATAKRCCEKKGELTEDESAAIYLYTMASPFFSTLNRHLRSMNKQTLRPWFAYLKLFITALNKLPSFKGFVWRGERERITFNYPDYTIQTWWAITSTSKYIKIIEPFLGNNGILYAIEPTNGKDVSQYAAIPEEGEVILMPGTRIQLMAESLEVTDRPLTLHCKEHTRIPQGKHVMFSHAISDETKVSQILQFLRDQSIPVWFDKDRGRSDNIYDSLAVGVENAAVICCFVNPDYERSARCQIELQYANKCHTDIILCRTTAQKNWEPVGWLKTIVQGATCVDLSESSIQLAANLLVSKLQELEYKPQNDVKRPNILFELIKYHYIRNSFIERLINDSKFPIEQTYINLAIIDSKKQQEKENKLCDRLHSDTFMDAFENIYDNKTPINVKDIFKKCKDLSRKIAVFGRAGIGKSTFCQHVAYQWATGSIWSEYELVVLVRLRCLTEQYYPTGFTYYPIDVLKRQYALLDGPLSEKDEKLLQDQFGSSHILWLLDGYDEIVQNVPIHLKSLLKQLLETPHHIITSRPYMDDLSHSVRLEITGFTNDNIPKYIEQFFKQLKDSLQNPSLKAKELLQLLKQNPRIWGIAHIPINIELICSFWSDTNRLEKKTLTMTGLYKKIIEWICRRYLKEKKHFSTENLKLMNQENVFESCKVELAFLESVAFNAMKNISIILQPTLLEKAEKETNCRLMHYPHLLNMGILKRMDDYPTGTKNEIDKNHHFVHLSFQEYLAARRLVAALNDDESQKMIEFIQAHKYNRRFGLMLSFASGLLANSNNRKSLDTFWDTILGEPLDMVGIRHMEVVIACMEEAQNNQNFKQWKELLKYVIKCVQYAVDSKQHTEISTYLEDALRRSPSLATQNQIIETLITLYEKTQDADIKANIIILIDRSTAFNLEPKFTQLLLSALKDDNINVRWKACSALKQIDEKAATKDMIASLVATLGDAHILTRIDAREILTRLSKKAARNAVISALVTALEDANVNIRSEAKEVLAMLNENAARNDIIAALMNALNDTKVAIRSTACDVLGQIGQKAATNDLIAEIEVALKNADRYDCSVACEGLGQNNKTTATKNVIAALETAQGYADKDVGSKADQALSGIHEKVANKNKITALVTALGNTDRDVNPKACEDLVGISKTAATKDAIAMLVTALEDANHDVSSKACKLLCRLGKTSARRDVIPALVIALGDGNGAIRWKAHKLLCRLGEEAVRNDVITALMNALNDTKVAIRSTACDVLGQIGQKAATNDLIAEIEVALKNAHRYDRLVACEDLGQNNKTTATKNVIAALETAQGYADKDVRSKADQALSGIHEKVANKNKITALVTALGNTDRDVNPKACKDLVGISKTAATKDAIAVLVTALEDIDRDVSSKACELLCRLGETTAKRDVIAALVTALRENVGARKALGRIGRKAGTKEVIAMLTAALSNKNSYVISEAYEVLGRIGKKAATEEVIAMLIAAVRGKNSDTIKATACETLGRIGKKAATEEVIAVLVTALENAYSLFKWEACGALGQMGGNAATNRVIKKLLCIADDRAYESVEKILVSSSSLSNLKSNTVSKLVDFWNHYIWYDRLVNNISVEKFMMAYKDTKIVQWCPIIGLHSLRTGCAITIVDKTIIVYGNSEPEAFVMPSRTLCDELVRVFTDQRGLAFYLYGDGTRVLQPDPTRTDPRTGAGST